MDIALSSTGFIQCRLNYLSLLLYLSVLRSFTCTLVNAPYLFTANSDDVNCAPLRPPYIVWQNGHAVNGPARKETRSFILSSGLKVRVRI